MAPQPIDSHIVQMTRIKGRDMKKHETELGLHSNATTNPIIYRNEIPFSPPFKGEVTGYAFFLFIPIDSLRLVINLVNVSRQEIAKVAGREGVSREDENVKPTL